MEIFGNVEGLKGSIERKYSSKIKQVEKEKEKQLEEIDEELKEKIELLRSKMGTAIGGDVRKTHSMILSEEKLKSKREFEEKRESIINKVFKEAEKKAKKIAHSKAYIDYVKANLPKKGKFSVKCDGAYYKKFFSKLKIDKKLVGLKFESEGLVYDFTLDNIIDSKKDVLRQEVSKVLFS